MDGNSEQGPRDRCVHVVDVVQLILRNHRNKGYACSET